MARVMRVVPPFRDRHSMLGLEACYKICCDGLNSSPRMHDSLESLVAYPRTTLAYLHVGPYVDG